MQNINPIGLSNSTEVLTYKNPVLHNITMNQPGVSLNDEIIYAWTNILEILDSYLMYNTTSNVEHMRTASIIHS